MAGGLGQRSRGTGRRTTSPAAQSSFNAVYGQVPGELAPKLALALACERGGEGDDCRRAVPDLRQHRCQLRGSAAFGMARIRAARGDVAGAVQALDLVPSTSRSYPEARRLRALQLYESGQGLPALAQAMDSINGVQLDPRERGELTAQILERAIAEVDKNGARPASSSARTRRRKTRCETGWRPTYRQLAGIETDAGASLRVG